MQNECKTPYRCFTFSFYQKYFLRQKMDLMGFFHFHATIYRSRQHCNVLILSQNLNNYRMRHTMRKCLFVICTSAFETRIWPQFNTAKLNKLNLFNDFALINKPFLTNGVPYLYQTYKELNV